MDWFADVAGVFLGYGIAWLFLAWRARRAAQTVMKSRTDGSY